MWERQRKIEELKDKEILQWSLYSIENHPPFIKPNFKIFPSGKYDTEILIRFFKEMLGKQTWLYAGNFQNYRSLRITLADCVHQLRNATKGFLPRGAEQRRLLIAVPRILIQIPFTDTSWSAKNNGDASMTKGCIN